MRTGQNDDEVLFVTYLNGEVDRFPEAVKVELPQTGYGMIAAVMGAAGALAVLSLAAVRKWEWVAAR